MKKPLIIQDEICAQVVCSSIGCVCACVFVCLCVYMLVCVCMFVCLTGKIVYRGRKMSAVRSGSSREYNNDNRAVWSLPDSSAKSYTKEEEESRQPRKTPEENSFLQKDGSPADGFFPSRAGSWLSKTNANSPSIKWYFEQVF